MDPAVSWGTLGTRVVIGRLCIEYVPPSGIAARVIAREARAARWRSRR